MTPQSFLELLWQYKPEEQYILIWTLQDKRSHWFQEVAKAAEFVAATKDLDVYVGVGLSKEDHGPTRRCKSEEVSGLCGIGTDLDLKSEAHGTKPLPTTIAEALSILPKDMPPTIIIATGNGAHAWWLFKEPHVFETEQERADVARVVTRWHTMLRLKSAARGWVYDRLSDLARVLRIAGTQNHKDPAKRKDVVVQSQTDRMYSLSDFEEYMDAAAIPDPDEEERAAREWADRFKDKPLIINPAARIPQELLDVWMDPKNSDRQTASRFRNTWERRRHDLKDPSQSGYDLALADFGALAGLADQQIVDLICHHRSMHGQKQRTQVDYFERTLAKATRRNPEGPATAAQQSPASSTANAVPPAKEMSPEDQKALLCEKISQAIGTPIQIMRLVKITGKDPSFRMELADDMKIEFTSVSKYRNQEAVRDALAGHTKWLMPPIKAVRWREIAQDMLHACFDEEGPIEVRWEEATRDTVGRYLENNCFIDDIATAHTQYRLKPIVKDGRIAINTTDLNEWINRTAFQNLTAKSLASQLFAIGAVQQRVTGKGFREQSRWLLPIEHFSPVEFDKGAAAQAAQAQEYGDAIQ